MSQILKYYENYDKAVGTYYMKDWHFTSRISYLKDFITEYTPKNGKILDVGCGDMFLETVLPDYDWTGIDININQSNNKAVKHNLETYPYPFPDKSFDTIVCSEVLEHLYDPVVVTREIRRLLKDDGTYIVSTPNFQFIDHYLSNFNHLKFDYEKHWTLEHIHNYDFLSHKQMLEFSKFKIIRFTGADSRFSKLLAGAVDVLHPIIESLYGKDEHCTNTDKIVGAMFPLHSHTIMIVAKPE